MSTGNTLTNLLPALYEQLDVVSREQVGLIPSVTLDASLATAGIGETVYSHVAPAVTTTSITPGPTSPDSGNQAIGTITLAIQRSEMVPIQWQGEESKGVDNGIGVPAIMKDQFAQAMRALCNYVESDLAGLYVNASRAIIPADTTIYKTDLADSANVRKILMDNGAPLSELKQVIGTTEGAALRTQAKLTTVLAAGQTMATQGILIDASGFQIRESAQIKSPVIGTAAATATVGTAAYAIGDTVLTLASAGSGTIIAGDVISIVGDTNYYVVASSTVTNVSGGGTITLAAPGLRVAITGSAAPAITVRAKGNKSMAFARSAIVLATRMPALPVYNGKARDMAADRTTITDPRSGLSFEVALYDQYRQIHIEIALAWGVKAVKTAHIALMSA